MGEISKKLIVSDDFVDIYKHFNVSSQIERMKNLTTRELYLLLIVALDKHSDEDPTVVSNFLEFEDLCMKIYDIQDDKETDDEDFKKLIEETGDKYIDVEVIVTSDGRKLPEPFTREEVRDIKIDNIMDQK
jgi:hypothetical protein